MDIARVKYVINEHLCDGITKDTMLLFLENLDGRAERGDKLENMWENLKSVYGYRTTYDALGQQQLGKLMNIMDKIKSTYFPKAKTKKERLNGMINNLNRLFNERDYFGTSWKMADLMDLLIELRDEEEDE